MMRYITGSLFIMALLLGSCKTSKTPTKETTKDPIVAYLGENPVYVSEFKYVYDKNTSNKDSAYTEQSLRDYLDLYLKFKLKVLDAKSEGIDTTKEFIAELSGYEDQLAKPYLRVKEVNDKLVRQTYERLKEEVNASHILIRVAPDAEPKDTLKAYKLIDEVRKKALAGEDFSILAKNYSQDPSARFNNGSLGYFTALQMVYPFEQRAYNTPVGQVSEILRTDYGYHIVKVNDRRNTSGKVRAAHIMLKTAKGQSDADSMAIKKKIDEIYNRLQKGEDWNTLCQQFSEDANSKARNGELAPFTIGTILPAFEEAAFALNKKGEYSKPVYTVYGWHIIQLLEKQSLEPFEELEPLLVQKISKDSRSDVGKSALLSKLQQENKMQVDKKVKDKALTAADSSLLQGKWAYGASDMLSETILSFEHPSVPAKKVYQVQEFFDYVKEKQVARKDLNTPSHYMSIFFDKFINEKTIEFEKENLAYKYEEYKMLAKEYREGMMLFQKMNDNVWGKAIKDTTGAREYYNSNKENYKWSKRVQATVYDAADKKVLTQVKAKKDQKLFINPDFVAEPIFFAKNNASIPAKEFANLNKLVNYLLQSADNRVEVGGHIDPLEKANVAAERIQMVVEYILKRGVAKGQIIQKDYGKYQPLSRTDRTQNSRVSFIVYSSDIQTLAKQLNEEAPLNLKIQNGIFQKGDNTYIDAVEWKEGSQQIEKNGRVIYVEIEKVEEPRVKTFEEARGYVISDYQTYLEKNWLEKLENTYPVKVEEEVLQSLIKK